MWNDHSRQQTIHLNNSNVPVFLKAPACKQHISFKAIYDLTRDEPGIFQTHAIPPVDDDDASTKIEPVNDGYPDGDLPFNPAHHVKPNVSQSPNKHKGPATKSSSSPNTDHNILTINFNQDESVPVVEDEELPDFEDPAHKLLSWHCGLGHLPFRKIKAIYGSGDLPRRLASCHELECTACHFGKATKAPWRTKGQSNCGKIKQAMAPGQCVSVNQLESTTPGLIAQLKG